MENELIIVKGPSSTHVTKEAAATSLRNQPGFPKNASVALDDVDGRWVAAVSYQKEAEFPPASDDEAPSGPPSDGPAEESPPKEEKSDDGPPKSEKKEEGGDDKSSEGAPHSKGGEEHMLAQVFDMLTKITDALGLSDPSAGMVPGADAGAVPPPGGPPHPGEGSGADPAMGKEPGVGSDNKMHTVHERSLKPGEAPPGTTPVGAPAFASVAEGHPWKDAIESNVKEFEVENNIGEESLSSVAAELKSLAEPYGYIVTDLAPSGAGTSRTASARIVRTR